MPSQGSTLCQTRLSLKGPFRKGFDCIDLSLEIPDNSINASEFKEEIEE